MPPAARQPEPPSVPHYAQQAWKLADLPPPGNGKRANIASVVAAAVELADEGGLAALSIRHLAQRLGLTPMAVYRHVESRDELIMLMVDAILGPPPTAGPGSASWPAALTRWGTAFYRIYEAHPWSLDAPIPGMPSTPNLVGWLDRLLGELESTGLSILERLNIGLLISGHVRHIANVRLRSHPIDPGQAPEALPEWLPRFVTPEAFPFYARIFEGGVFGREPGPDIEYGLARIIDGIHARCAQLSTGTPSPG